MDFFKKVKTVFFKNTQKEEEPVKVKEWERIGDRRIIFTGFIVHKVWAGKYLFYRKTCRRES
jgi:hypothetical protein